MSSALSPRFAFYANSALAFASAQLIMAALHEAGHGLAAQALGFSPRIYAFYEDNPTGDARQTLIILAAGPLASLALGLLFWLWYSGGKPRYSYGRLLLLWMSIHGVMTFVNYLIVTPFLGAGDTAQIANVLHWGIAPRYAVALAGVLLVIALARPAATALFGVAPASFELTSLGARRGFILRGFYLPLIAGVVLTALAGIGTHPLNVFYGLLGTFGTIDIVVAALYARSAPLPEGHGVDSPLRIEAPAIALYAALVLVYVLAFTRGVPV